MRPLTLRGWRGGEEGGEGGILVEWAAVAAVEWRDPRGLEEEEDSLLLHFLFYQATPSLSGYFSPMVDYERWCPTVIDLRADSMAPRIFLVGSEEKKGKTRRARGTFLAILFYFFFFFFFFLPKRRSIFFPSISFLNKRFLLVVQR